MAIDVAQGMIEQAFSNNPQQSTTNDPLTISTNAPPPSSDRSFAQDMFGVTSPDDILKLVGPHPNNPNYEIYQFQDGKKYPVKTGTPKEEILQKIWERESPGLYGAAKGSALYGLPADMSSAVAYGLGGLGLDESAQDWRTYSDKLKEEYYQKYGQFQVPGVEQAWNQGKLWDYALQTLGQGAPYMGLALAGGGLGLAGTSAAGAATTTATGGLTLAGALGSFLGSTAITSPITIAQFADRQVADQKAKGIENPVIDWWAAAGLGTLAAGLQAIPVESILFGGPLLKTLEMWGAKTGTSTSARLLASIADVAGSNALANMGISALSRLNADMPMLDDDAKSEYLNSGIMGSLVGIPFGAFKGLRTKSHKQADETPPRPLEETLDEAKEPDVAQSTTPDTEQNLVPNVLVNPKDIIFDPRETYGINNFREAGEYLSSLKYNDLNGRPTDGLEAFVYQWSQAKKAYSDEDMITSARMAKRAHNHMGNLARAEDGILYKTIDDLPQVHSDKPEVLTKAAALADKYGYPDAQVKQMPDTLIETLFNNKLKGDLLRAQGESNYPKEVFQEVLNKFKAHTDEAVLKEVQEYGSLYRRPVSKERYGKDLAERRANIDKNPRKELAEALMNTRQQAAALKAQKAAQGEKSDFPLIPHLDEFQTKNFQDDLANRTAQSRKEMDILYDKQKADLDKVDANHKKYAKSLHKQMEKLWLNKNMIKAAIEDAKDGNEDFDGYQFGKKGEKAQYIIDAQNSLHKINEAIKTVENKISKSKERTEAAKNKIEDNFFAEQDRIQAKHTSPKDEAYYEQSEAKYRYRDSIDGFVDDFRPAVNGPKLLMFSGATPENVVKALDAAATRPGAYATKNMTKADFAKFILNTPFFKKLMKNATGKDKYTLEEAWDMLNRGKSDLKKTAAKKKRQEEALANPYPEPKVDATGEPVLKEGPRNSFSTPSGKTGKPVPYKFKADVHADQLIKDIRDHLEQMAVRDRAAILAKYPELGPSLSQMAKTFHELSSVTELQPVTKVVKGAFGIMESLGRRSKLLSTVSKALENIGKGSVLGAHFSKLVDDMIGGKDTSPANISDVFTLFNASFAFDAKGKIPEGTLNPTAVENLYKTMRSVQSKQAQAKLDAKVGYLKDWYQKEKGLSIKDLEGIPASDIEAAAFNQYLNGSFKPDYKAFNASPQKAYFQAIERSLKRIKNDLDTQGIMQTSDIFEYNKDFGAVRKDGLKEKVAPDAQRPETFVTKVVDDINHKSAEKTLTKQSEQVQEAAAEREGDVSKSDFDKPPTPPSRDPDKIAGGHQRKLGGVLHKFASLVGSVPFLARHIPAWATHYNDVLKIAHEEAANNLRLTKKLERVLSGPNNNRKWVEVEEASNLIAHMRKTDQLLEKDLQGRHLVVDTKGAKKALDINVTNTIDDILEFTRDAMRIGSIVTRANIGKKFQEEGLTSASSLAHVKRAIDEFDTKMKGNPFPEERGRLQARKESLGQFHTQLREFEEHIQNNVPYIPFMRFGDYAVQVVSKATGKQVYFGMINDTNKFGSDAPLPNRRDVAQKIAALKLHEKYDPKDYKYNDFKMTYEQITKHIHNGAVSAELLQGLIASGINKNLKVVDKLATGVLNHKEIMDDIRSTVANSQERALKYIAAKGVGRFGIKSDNIEGHSVDWARVFDSYKNIWAASHAKQSKMIDLIEHQAALQEDQSLPSHVIRRIEKYLDYVNSPDSDYAGVRTFNFVFAMGFNPASALLQTATLPNQVLGATLEFSPNLIHNAGVLAKETKNAYLALISSKGFAALDPHTRMLSESEPGFFRTSIRQDSVAGRVLGQSTTTSRSAKALQTVGDYSGFMIGRMEQMTRLAAFSTFYRILKESPDASRQMLKSHIKDQNWQKFWDNYKDKYDLETVAALYKMQETHGVFGKVARGPIQRGLGGSLFFPFSSYGQQMLELIGDQLTGHRGMPGVYAGLWSMSAFVTMAGLAGIPAYELMKTMYEVYEQNVNGRTTDADMELKEAGVPDWLKKGLLSDATGLSLSNRLGQMVVGEQLLQGLLKGELKVGDLGGVPGRAAQNMLTAASDILDASDGRNITQKLIPAMPTALANLAKSYELAVHPEEQMRTAKGNLIGDPTKDVLPEDILGTAMGFTPQKFTDSREQIFFRQVANREFSQAQSRFAESAAHARYLHWLGSTKGDPEMMAAATRQIKEVQDSMLGFMRKNKIPAGTEFWKNFNRNVADRLTEKRNPGKILKPTKGERRHMEVFDQ